MTGVAGAGIWLRTQAQIFLADPQPGDYDPDTGKGPEWGKAAPVALLIILLMAIALFFLIRSMGKHLKKVPPNFALPTDASGATSVGPSTGKKIDPADGNSLGAGDSDPADGSLADASAGLPGSDPAGDQPPKLKK